MTFIHLQGVKQNNLKNIDVSIPIGSFTVVCGPSGSGKSSLAFETLYAEGQRRYIESLSNYAKQFVGKAPKPDIESAENLPPALALEQKNAVKTSRSTVGTTTEILDLLRLLFEKLGRVECPTYGHTLKSQPPTKIFEEMITLKEGGRFYVLAPIFGESRSLQGKELLAALLGEGFLRIYIPPKETKRTTSKLTNKLNESNFPPCKPPKELSGGTLLEISPKTKPTELPKTDFYVVVDRVVLRTEDRGRLIDSFQQAYHASVMLNNGLAGGRLSLLSTEGEHHAFSEDHGCHQCGFGLPRVTSHLLSFNSPVGACPTCSGFGNTLIIDPNKVIPNPKLSLSE